MECPICKKEFISETGRRPKRFCSDSCRIKFWNDNKKAAPKPKAQNKPQESPNSETKVILPPKTETPTIGLEIPPMPTREDGEDVFAFAGRKNEWKRLYQK